jgi:hypothetical protein
VKVKFNQRQEFVIGGMKPNATSLESFLIGYYEGNKLHFAGKVRAGLTPHLRGEILRATASDKTTRCPFVNLPIGKTTHWGEGHQRRGNDEVAVGEAQARCRSVVPEVDPGRSAAAIPVRRHPARQGCGSGAP